MGQHDSVAQHGPCLALEIILTVAHVPTSPSRSVDLQIEPQALGGALGHRQHIAGVEMAEDEIVVCAVGRALGVKLEPSCTGV
jgi:hypothetical protein